MFVGNIENYTSIANATVPIRTELSTNRKVTNNNGVIEIRKPGIYKVNGYLQMLGIAGDVSVFILHDGQPVREITVTLATASSVGVIPLADAFRCLTAQYPNIGTVTIQIDTAGLTVDGLVSVEYIQ